MPSGDIPCMSIWRVWICFLRNNALSSDKAGTGKLKLIHRKRLSRRKQKTLDSHLIAIY